MYRLQTWLLVGAASAALAACTTTTQPGTSSQPTEPMTTASASLQAFHWDVTRVVNSAGQEVAVWRQAQAADRPPMRLSFTKEERLAVQNLCNVLSAPYQLGESSIAIGPVVGTMRACVDRRLMELEHWVGGQLPDAAAWQLRKAETTAAGSPSLPLTFKDGSRWELSGFPTDETRYGSAPERVFLEVAPEMVSCSHPLMPNAKCLQVREIQYNEQGIQTAAGPWQAFYGDIDGFAFEEGIRSVLRLNRYTRQNPPADASRFVYVLDMRVRSERVR